MKHYRLFGDPVAHSLSPVFQNAAFQAAGIEAEYAAERIEGKDLAAAVERIRSGELAGANITIPHKEAAFALCGDLTAEARRLGVVNWLGRSESGPLMGDNTDAAGFSRALEEAGVEVRGSLTVVLGAGGAARAAALCLARGGARSVVVGARRAEQAVALEKALALAAISGVALESAKEAARAAAVVVSAVPPDKWGEVAPVDLLARTWVCDLSYAGRQKTPAENWAEAKGLRALGGLPMLLHQGAISFERWTGKRFPIKEARAALGLTP